MMDAEVAKRIGDHLRYVQERTEYKSNLALSLLMECGGRMYEVERILYEAQVQWEKLVKGEKE